MAINELHYKDKSPSETVNKIKSILNRLNIETTEEWIVHNEIDTYSLRVSINGSSLGSNGKGVTKEYALASAYSELMERYQNMWLGKSPYLWKSKYDFKYYEDEKCFSAEEIIESDSAFIRMYLEKRGLLNATFEEKVEAFKKYQKMDFNISGIKNNYISVPFYNICKSEEEFLPYFAYTSYYASNGMCAGNTVEEALVQGLSEIIERFVQKKIIRERIALPNIPEEYIKKFPDVYRMYSEMKNNKEFTVIFKDCSLGGIYPVAALIIIENNTNKYGVKLGCHPDYGIAMERAITEAAQGNNIYDYVNRSKLDFYNINVDNDTNILNGYKTGFAQFPYEIFKSPAKYKFVESKSVRGLTNYEILNLMIEGIKERGYEILVRDVSYLDYPSYHIIIPNLSEIIDMTDKWFNAINTKFHIMNLINNPSYINKSNCRYIINAMDFFANSHLENTMRSYYGVLTNLNCPAEEYGLGWLYYTAICHVILGNYREAAKRMNMIIQRIDIKDKKNEFYCAVLYYLEGMDNINSHIDTINYLKLFYSEEICSKISNIFEKNEEVIIKQYEKHNYMNFEVCSDKKCCDYYLYRDLIEKFKEVQNTNKVKRRFNGVFHK